MDTIISGPVADVASEEWIERLTEAEQLAAVGQLAASVVHEIGAPLTAISVTAEKLMKQPCGGCPVASRDLALILSQTHRIAELLRRLVDLAQPAQPALRRVDLNGVVRDGYELVGQALRRARIEARLDLDPHLPPVHADPRQLLQVFVQLAMNAERALAQRGGTLVVSTSGSGAAVELVVADDGPGIDPEDLSRVFLPFFSRHGGTGLGLPLARQIVHKHGGTIRVETAPGAGARFIVRLPVET